MVSCYRFEENSWNFLVLFLANGLIGAKNVCPMDGIPIAPNLNAIDAEGNPIAGRYGIGNDSGGCFGNESPCLATGMACGRMGDLRAACGQGACEGLKRCQLTPGRRIDSASALGAFS